MDTLLTFNHEVKELFNKHNEIWNKASKWFKMDNFAAFNPAIYQTFLEGTMDNLAFKRYVVKQLLVLENEQWNISDTFWNDFESSDLSLFDGAYQLNHAMILNILNLNEGQLSYLIDIVDKKEIDINELEETLDYHFEKIS